MMWLACILATALADELPSPETAWRVDVGPAVVWWKSASRHLITPGANLTARYARRHIGATYDVLFAYPQQPGPSYDIQYLRLHQAIMISGFLGPDAARGHASVGPSVSVLQTRWQRPARADTLTLVSPGLRWTAGMEGRFLHHGTWSWHIGGVATSLASMDFDVGLRLGGAF